MACLGSCRGVGLCRRAPARGEEAWSGNRLHVSRGKPRGTAKQPGTHRSPGRDRPSLLQGSHLPAYGRAPLRAWRPLPGRDPCDRPGRRRRRRDDLLRPGISRKRPDPRPERRRGRPGSQRLPFRRSSPRSAQDAGFREQGRHRHDQLPGQPSGLRRPLARHIGDGLWRYRAVPPRPRPTARPPGGIRCSSRLAAMLASTTSSSISTSFAGTAATRSGARRTVRWMPMPTSSPTALARTSDRITSSADSTRAAGAATQIPSRCRPDVAQLALCALRQW